MNRKSTYARNRIQSSFQARPALKPLVLALLAMAPLSAAPVLAAEGGQVIHGQGEITRNGNATTINQQSNALILNWANFNIAPNERVQFLQPSSSSLALNRVLASDPTAIFGQLLANGQIFLINPHGITFGAGAQVNVAGLVASTLDISNADFLGGAASGKFTFSGAGNGRIVNQASIVAEKGGYVALIARQVSNQGSLTAPEGSIALAAGDRITLSHASGLLNVSVEAATLDALVENKQAIRADGGVVILSAKAENALLNTVVNQTGIVEARSVENRNGRIFLSGGPSGVVNVTGTLDASGKNPGERGGDVTITGANIALNNGSSINASGAAAGGTVLAGGDYQGGGDTPRANALWMDAAAGIAANATLDGPGGKVVLWSDEATRAYGSISATGTQAGGLVETSGHYLDVAGIKVDASSPLGAVGLWLLDPNNIAIQTAGANTNISAGPNFTTTKDSAILTTATIQSALNAGGGTSVVITTGTAAPNTQAGNITFATNSKINYSGTNAGVGLTLNAHNNIVANTGTAITASAGKLDVTFNAGKQASGNGVITLATTTISSNGGKITLNGAPNGGGASGPRGLLLTASTLNAAGGDIALNAIGGTTSATTNRGVELSGSTLNTTGTGTISLTGVGGSKANNYGVLLTATSKLQSVDGNITLNGKAGAASIGTGIGVLMDTTSSIVSTKGKIAITGTGSSGATGTANHGVQISTVSGISSTTGNIQITGTGGTGTGNDAGVRIVGTSPISTGGSSINVTGKSVSTGATNGNLGVEISGAATLTNSNAAGLIDINGTGGGGAGTNRFGVTVAGSTVQATAGGSINIIGVGGGKFAGINIAATNPVIGNALTKDVSLTASNGGGGDALAIAAGSKLRGTGTLTVQGANAAATMGVGGAASATFNLQMDTTELGLIQPGFANLVFGRGDGSGAITVGAGTTNANTTIQASTSNVTINGAFATTGSKLTLSTGGAVTESGTLTVNAGAGTLQLQNGGTFNLTNNNNTGTLNATGTALNFRDDTGFAVSGITTTGNVTLSTAGNVTQTGTIVAGPGTGGTLNLNGAGGVYNLCTQNNDIATLNANTKTVAFNDINTYALGTLTLTGALELAGNFGTSGKITVSNFLFDAPTRNVTFSNSGTIGTIAAKVAGLNYSQANSLTIGKVSNTLCNPGTVNGITSSGNVAVKTTGANSDITLAANTPISFTGVAPGTVKLEAQRNIALNAGSSIASSSQAIDVTLNANLQGVAAGGGNITLTSATITSKNGNIVLAGDPGGTGFASNKTGNGITLNAATLDSGNGGITLRGEGRGAANASGVSLINSSVVKSAGGTTSITGKNADVSALAGQTGVAIASNSLVNATGANAVSVTGTSGAGTGTGNAGVVVQSGGRVSATNGALTVTGTSTGKGAQAIGVLVTGANSKIDGAGTGALTITGVGSSAVGASAAAGVSIANTASVLGKDGATNLAGNGGTNSAGVQITNATAGANGLGTFTIAGKGNGTAAGLTTSGAQPTMLADKGGTLIVEASNGGGADALVLAATTKIQGNGNLIVRGANAADTMGIGGAATAAHRLQIDQTELATIQPGLANITFGRSDGTGLITIGAGSTNAATTIQAATANMSITGTYSSVGADLTLTTAGIATESSSNHALIVNGGAGTLNLLGGGTYNLCKGDNDTGTLTANATELAFNDINNLTLGTPFNVTNDVALGVNGTLTAASGINGGGLSLFGSNVTFNNLGNVGKLAATVTGDFTYSQANSYAIDTVNNACLGSAVNGITAGGNVSLSVGAGNTVTQTATGLISANDLTLNGGLFTLTQNNSIVTLSANAEELALRDDGGYAVGGVTVSGATRLISNGGTVTQTGAIVSDGLALTGSAGVFKLNDPGNKINTLAGDTGDIRFVSSAGFALGSVTTTSDSVTTAGVAANTVGLTSNGAVTQDASGLITATGLALNGAGGTFNLNQSGNDVQTLALDTSDVRFADSNGFDLGSVTTAADGVTTTGATISNNLGLTSDGLVTQSQAISAAGIALNGTAGTFNLGNVGNNVSTLAADTKDIRFADSNGFAIGSVTTVDGSTTTGLSASASAGLTANGSVTQSAAVTTPALALNGLGGIFNLDNIANDVQTLALDTQAVRFADGNGFAMGGVTTAADGLTTTGASAASDVGLTSNGSVTQTAAIISPSLALNGAGGAFTLDHPANDINTLAADSGDLFIADSNGVVIGSVTTSADNLTTNGVTATGNAGLESSGPVTQTAPIVASGLALTGAGGAFDLSLAGNDVTTFAAATGTLRFSDDNGFNVGTVTTLNGPVTGVTASGDVELTAASGTVTQDSDAPLQVGGILNLIGGTFSFGNANNQVGVLSANGVSLSFRDDSGFSVAGITMTDTACLLSDGSVTQTAAIIADALGLGGAGTFNLGNGSNDVNTLAASGQALVFGDVDGFAIGTVTPIDGAVKIGITATDSIVLISGGDVTQTAAISANGLALNGAGANFTLNHVGNNVATLAGNANRIDYSQSGSLAIGSVTGADASITNGINVNDRVTVQTTDLLANLTLNSPVAAQGTGFAAVLSTQRDFINNVGATGLQTPNGVWVLYANNPITSVFNGLTAPTNVFENSITTLPPTSLPAGANAIVFQTRAALVPPTGRNPTVEDFSQVGLQLLTLDAAESLYSDLLSDVRGYDFLDLWKRYGYVPLEVMYGGMKVPEGLAIQEVDLQKLRRRLGISGDPGHRYIWWR
jgi:filamentous hemagglutinin family protein